MCQRIGVSAWQKCIGEAAHRRVGVGLSRSGRQTRGSGPLGLMTHEGAWPIIFTSWPMIFS
jgi:hypothetical protein